MNRIQSFQPTKIDLLLSIIAAIIMPFICSILYDLVGALIPLLIYYGFFCFGIVYVRKKTLNYSLPDKLFTNGFLFLFAFEIFRIFLSIFIYEPMETFNLPGFLLTLFIWAPINAFSEQLIWIYVYESFANFYQAKSSKRKTFKVIGFILYLTIIALIHILFWTKFLFESESQFPWTIILISGNFILSFGYLYLYLKSKSMVPVFIIHLIVDSSAVILSLYSIIPYLFI
ncbi:MAG: conserved membrane protein of unknown function [Promethearchaeota archaeon]|nr:MAG: conserved membrane protein of unknown function [Candidatus Lokiarchaeota archaeon]